MDFTDDEYWAWAEGHNRLPVFDPHAGSAPPVPSQRGDASWFLFTGFALIIIEALVDWIEKRDIDIPSFLLWSFLIITVAGALIMPVSGVWLLLIPVYGLLRRR